jgi:hypothetical protein
LEVGAVYGMLAGTLLCGLALVPGSQTLSTVLCMMFPSTGVEGGPVTSGVRLATAVSGALTAGWGAMAWSLRAKEAAPSGADRRVGRALSIGLVVWFVLDSTASVWLGSLANVVGNLTFLLALLPPAVAYARVR